MRVVVYDKTCVKSRGRLSPIWAAGARLYRGVGRIDAVHGVASWDEALTWLATHKEPLREIQYWGHGKWGNALVGEDVFDATALTERRVQLEAVRERLAPNALVWFRTCQTFGAKRGIDFAERLGDFLGARVAGHTYIIAFHQSGLRALAPGSRADWAPDEGLREGTPDDPQRAKWSRPWLPRTITALTGAIPANWVTR
ncbi:MAG TPA: DUF4347 domain-containing protein [Kofleriaceae bacterium]